MISFWLFDWYGSTFKKFQKIKLCQLASGQSFSVTCNAETGFIVPSVRSLRHLSRGIHGMMLVEATAGSSKKCTFLFFPLLHHTAIITPQMCCAN
jgi:hypothetical protein